MTVGREHKRREHKRSARWPILWAVTVCLLVAVIVLVAQAVNARSVAPVQASPPISIPSMLVGHVSWQGRPPQTDYKQNMAVSLWLKQGTKVTSYPIELTDASGFFTVTLVDVPRGTYDWRVKDADFAGRYSTYLAKAGTIKVGDAPVTNLEVGVLKGGDTNNDNVISMSDFVTVRRSFGPCSSDGCADTRADINNDNTVNVTDFNLVKTNFGQAGAPPFGR